MKTDRLLIAVDLSETATTAARYAVSTSGTAPRSSCCT